MVFADSMEKIAPDAFVNCPNLDEATRETLESFGCTVKTKKRNGNGIRDVCSVRSRKAAAFLTLWQSIS